MNIEVAFANAQQREFYYTTKRNQCFSGGFNNGKSYGGCLKLITLLTTFPKYRAVIARQTFADLKKTTMETFFKLCPKGLVERHNEQDGLTILYNGSRIDWLHLDKVDESTLRGLEVNSILVDQAEEVDEKVYDVLDARVGRWDEVVIPPELLAQFPEWPTNKKTGKFIAPSYMMLLCNPDTQYHFIYRKYHPESVESDKNFFFVEGEWDSGLGSEESYKNALKHDDEWVNKYIKGKWGISTAQIHRLDSSSQLEPTEELLERIKRKGNLFRSLDHGEVSPTCCLWFAAIGGVHICYREYYQPNELISNHRQNISDMSEAERYSANYADPSIFDKWSQKKGGFWTVADEYVTSEFKAPALHWIAADNNEFATRNRINELLKPSDKYKHPVTGVTPAPGLYFIKKSETYPVGCHHSIQQLQSQRRELIGYVDGKAVYCDDRDKKVTDHAYDPTRYYVGVHSSTIKPPQKAPPQNSIKWFQMMRKRQSALVAASN